MLRLWLRPSLRLWLGLDVKRDLFLELPQFPVFWLEARRKNWPDARVQLPRGRANDCCGSSRTLELIIVVGFFFFVCSILSSYNYLYIYHQATEPSLLIPFCSRCVEIECEVCYPRRKPNICVIVIVLAHSLILRAKSSCKTSDRRSIPEVWVTKKKVVLLKRHESIWIVFQRSTLDKATLFYSTKLNSNWA